MKIKLLLFVFSLLAVFYFSFSQTIIAYDIAACTACSDCKASTFGLHPQCANFICRTVSCMSSKFECEGTYKVDRTACLYSASQTGVCKSGKCVECLTNVDCTNPAKPNCDTSTHTCKAAVPICNNNGIQDNGETGIDCGGGGCPACSVCTASLSFPTVGTGDPCGITASISATNCDGKSYQVKEGTAVISGCSGTVSGSAFSTSCSFTQSGTKSYDLYVDSAKKDTKSAGCGACSSYTSSTSCSGGGCYWCASPNTPANTCVQSAVNCAPPSTTCSGYGAQISCETSLTANCDWCAGFPSGYCVPEGQSCIPSSSCSGKTQTQCTGDCAWCSSSGSCVAGKDYTTQCENCYKEQEFSLGLAYSYCRDRCKIPPSGYISSWCLTGWSNTGKLGCDSVSTYGNSCKCKGLVFDSSKSNDGIVNCGECAINANNKDCGGTAATYGNVYTDTELGKIEWEYGDEQTWGCCQVKDSGTCTQYTNMPGSALGCCQKWFSSSEKALGIGGGYYYYGQRRDNSYFSCTKTTGHSGPEGNLVQGTLSYSNRDTSYTGYGQKWTNILGVGNIVDTPQPLLSSQMVGPPCPYITVYADGALIASKENNIFTGGLVENYGYTVPIPKSYFADGDLIVQQYHYYNNWGQICSSYAHGIVSYSYYAAPSECSDTIDNDRDCLVDCADPDCSSATVCASKTAKTSCNMAGGTGCDATCPSGQDCLSGVCQPPSCTAGWKCKDSNTKAFQKSDCTWTTAVYCDYGCANSACKDGVPPVMDCANPSYFSVTPSSPTDSDKITITAQASDNVAVSKIELLVDGQVVKTCNSGYCSTSQGSYSAGSSHTASAKAYDAAGNKKECSKGFSVVSIPVDCVNAKSGGQCNVGDIGKTITCPGACSANALCSGSTVTYVCG